MNTIKHILLDGIWRNNISIVQLLGLCPLLAISNTTTNALVLGATITSVLVFSNIIISILRHWIPNEIRIPIYVMIIASTVSIVQMIINAYMFNLYKTIGTFIPLIVTNCTIISRIESFASKQKPLLATIDALVIGIGSTFALFVLGAIREILGHGTIFRDADQLLGNWAQGLFFNLFYIEQSFLLAILPPGAFIGLGFILAGKYLIDKYTR